MQIDAFNILKNRFIQSQYDTFFITLDDIIFTYGDIWFNALEISASWKNEGITQGDKIAFIIPNNIALIIFYISCIIGGFTACPIVNTLHENTINELLKRIKPAKIVTEIPEIKSGIGINKNINFESDHKINSVFIIFFTSGTTGESKAICHSINSVIGSALSFSESSGMFNKTRLYHIIPMAYMAGFLNTMLAPFVSGGTIIQGPLFSPASAVDFWTRPLNHNVNTLSIVPTIAYSLCQLTRDIKTIKLIKKSISQIQCTSAPINTKLRMDFYKKFSIPLQDCYGITELGGPLSFQSYNDAMHNINRSKLLPGIEISIKENSILWIKSSYLMLGYLKENELQLPLDDNGFMNTGDLAVVKNEQIQIIGREKEIIIRGGINVSPFHIESIISSMSEIKEVTVIGIEHEFWGEEIVACVIPKKKYSGLKNKIMIFCRKNLSIHEIPDRIEFMEQFPKSFIGKVIKRELQEIFKRKK